MQREAISCDPPPPPRYEVYPTCGSMDLHRQVSVGKVAAETDSGHRTLQKKKSLDIRKCVADKCHGNRDWIRRGEEYKWI